MRREMMSHSRTEEMTESAMHQRQGTTITRKKSRKRHAEAHGKTKRTLTSGNFFKTVGSVVASSRVLISPGQAE